MIWIFRRKTKTQYSKLCTVIKPLKTNNKVELLSLPLVWSIWNDSINILKEIYSRTASLKQKLLLLCGDVEANPGPYNKGKLTSIQCDVKMESTITTATCKAINILGGGKFLFFFNIFQLKYNKKIVVFSHFHRVFKQYRIKNIWLPPAIEPIIACLTQALRHWAMTTSQQTNTLILYLYC